MFISQSLPYVSENFNQILWYVWPKIWYHPENLINSPILFPSLPRPGAALVLIDTTGCDMFELATPSEVSKANEGEVALVCVHVEALVGAGVDPAEIAVITPYNLQVRIEDEK